MPVTGNWCAPPEGGRRRTPCGGTDGVIDLPPFSGTKHLPDSWRPMHAVLLEDPALPAEVADVDLGDPQAGEGRVRVTAAGVCHYGSASKSAEKEDTGYARAAILVHPQPPASDARPSRTERRRRAHRHPRPVGRGDAAGPLPQCGACQGSLDSSARRRRDSAAAAAWWRRPDVSRCRRRIDGPRLRPRPCCRRASYLSVTQHVGGLGPPP